VTVVHPIWQKTRPEVDGHRGWIFGKPSNENSDITSLKNSDGNGGPFLTAYPGNDPDPFFQSKTIRDLYDHAGDTEGKYSVPILWDKIKGTIVSNESAEIIRMFNSPRFGFTSHRIGRRN